MDIQKVARHLLDRVGADWLPKVVRESLRESGPPVHIACSGGADSVFLLLWSWAYLNRTDSSRELVVLHFNHCLRGEFSDGDEAYVVSLADSLGLRAKTGKWLRAGDEKISEESARKARLDFFDSCVGDEQPFVLSGHHADDVVESMLMRLSRGSGTSGLCSPRPLSELGRRFRMLRPLVSLRRQEIVDALVEAGVKWREDESNGEDLFYRNRLRNSVVPAWQEAADREVSVGVGFSRTLLEEDADALDLWLDREWGGLLTRRNGLDLDGLRELPVALQRRALQRLVIESDVEGGLTLAVVETFLSALVGGSSLKVSVGKDWRLVVDGQARLVWIEAVSVVVGWDRFQLPVGTSAYLPSGGRVRCTVVQLDEAERARIMSGAFSHEDRVVLKVSEKHVAGLCVRSWREGDAYVPIGLNGPKKLSRLFGDRKISQNCRRTLPLFVDSRGSILWSPGLPPNKLFQIDSKTTRALQLTYEA